MSICYLCENEGADTTEHVVPRCLYPSKLPSDVITLPAHSSCNRYTAKDEEAFRNHIAASIPPENPGHALWRATWKAIHRPEAKGMQQTYYQDMLSLPELGEDGVVRARPIATRLLNERADRVIAKIVKGLFTWKTGELMPSADVLWRFGQADRGHDEVRLPNAFTVHDVLEVRWGRALDEPLGTLWILGFHRVAWFWAATHPRGAVVPQQRDDLRQMVWPGPPPAVT